MPPSILLVPPSLRPSRVPTTQPPLHGYRILSFDGGGMRALSSLYILKNFMDRLMLHLNETSQAPSDIPLRPCDHFDLICGSGTGGLLALLFGRLGMTTQEAIEKYMLFAEKTFQIRRSIWERLKNGKQWNDLLARLGKGPIFDGDILRNSLQEIVGHRSKHKDAPMKSLEGSKTLVLACTSAMAEAPPRRFRSYQTKLHSADSASVVDVARACCATPGLFGHMTIDNEALIDASSCGYANPTEIALDEAKNLWPDSRIGCVLSLGTGQQEIVNFDGPWATILQQCQKLIENSSHVEYRLFKDLRTMPPSVYFRFNVDRGLRQEWLNVTGSGGIAGITAGYLRNPRQEHQMEACVTRHSPGDDHIIITAEMRSRLENLHPIVESTWRYGSICTPETRVEILAEIEEWATNVNSPRVLWLLGPAKSGKSTIAQTIVRKFDSPLHGSDKKIITETKPFLGAFVLGGSGVAPDQVLLSVFSEMARRIPRYAVALSDALRDPYVVPRASPQRQLQELLIQIKHSLDIARPIVVVLDALDECGDGHSRVALLAALTMDLPLWIKLFITSRAAPDITRTMDRIRSRKVILDICGQKTIRDVERFLRQQLKTIYFEDPLLIIKGVRNVLPPHQKESHYQESLHGTRSPPQTWITVNDMNTLIKCAGGLFIYASFIGSFLRRAEDPQVALRELLCESPQPSPRIRAALDELHLTLDELYLTALYQACPKRDTPHIFQSVIGSLLALKTPLKLEAFCDLLRFCDEALRSSVQELISELIGLVLIHNDDSPVTVVHPTFTDFVTRRCEDPAFSLKSVNCAGQLALCCFAKMTLSLKRDICRIEDTAIPNDKIKGRDKYVSESLLYACCFWASHLSDADSSMSEKLTIAVRSFLSYRLLRWIEVMSLFGKIPIAQSALGVLIKWLDPLKDEDWLRTLANDASRFIGKFAIALQENALQVYYSALPFLPAETALFGALHVPRVQDRDKIPHVLTNQLKTWDRCYVTLMGHRNEVRAVAFSPNASRIVSGSFDRTVRIWDVTTGTEICKPLRGHRGGIRSIAFSPDGSQIVSGSSDGAVQVWNATTDEHWQIGDLLCDQTAGILAVAFSPDGSRIVWASDDCKICTWDAATRKMVDGSLNSRNGIKFAAISPDALRVVSGSSDYTVRIWNIKGEQIGEPLDGYKKSIRSVSFSPNGLRIVSGSFDGTICIWNATTGQQIGGPMIGHTASVLSVAFSSDVSHIVSGSKDRTVRVWDAKVGNQVGEPLRGHTANISSVAFSADGSRIISGSDDGTIRVWNAKVDRRTAGLPGSLTVAVSSVAFSPDGSRVVSGMDDGTISFWDADRGEQVRNVLRGHATSVVSVEFSSDGLRIISRSYDTNCVWDAVTKERIPAIPGDHLEVIHSAVVDGHGGITLSEKFKFITVPGVKCVIHKPTKKLAFWSVATPLTIIDLSPVGESLLGW